MKVWLLLALAAVWSAKEIGFRMLQLTDINNPLGGEK